MQHHDGFDPALGSLPTSGPETTPPAPSPQPTPTQTTTRSLTATRTPTSCVLCGGEPASLFRFADITGFVFRWSRRSYKGVWCGACAQAIGRRAQSRTLLTGWFGVIAAAVNLATVFKNSAELRRAAALPTTPQPSTLDTGRPVLLRAGLLGALAAVGFVSFIVYTIASDATKDVDDLAVADCLHDPGFGDLETVETISCDEPHDLEVYEVARLDQVVAFPGEPQLNALVDEACYYAFAEYVGISWDESSLDYSFITPSYGSWNSFSDRTYYCLLGSPTGPTTGSARGTNS